MKRLPTKGTKGLWTKILTKEIKIGILVDKRVITFSYNMATNSGSFLEKIFINFSLRLKCYSFENF